MPLWGTNNSHLLYHAHLPQFDTFVWYTVR